MLRGGLACPVSGFIKARLVCEGHGIYRGAAGNAGPVGGRDAVDEAVVRRLGDRFGDRGAGVELPSEQLTEVVPELLWVLADDLEVHNRVCHEYSLRRSLVLLAMLRFNDRGRARNSSASRAR